MPRKKTESPTPSPSERGSNIAALKRTLKEKFTSYEANVKDRGASNAELSAIRATVKNLGVDTDAFLLALRRKNMDPEDRDHFDESYMLCCEAVNLPLREDLFDHAAGAEFKEKTGIGEENPSQPAAPDSPWPDDVQAAANKEQREGGEVLDDAVTRMRQSARQFEEGSSD